MNSSNIENEMPGTDATHVHAGHLIESEAWSYGSDPLTRNYADTILLVEDESFVREVTREVLQSAGYQVFSAGNAVEAANIFEQSESEIDLLLTDVILPGESGRLLGAKLRQKNPGLKILYVTGYGEQMGGMDNECLAKPFSTDTLLQRVRRILTSANFRGERDTNSSSPAAARKVQNLSGNIL